ncbi:MAG: extracellular solute-binding protein [Clostridiaceae bacterium]
MRFSIKLVSTLMILMLSFTLFTGCGSTTGSDEATTAKAENTATSAGSSAPPTQEPKPKVDVSLELCFLPSTLAENQSSNLIAKYIEEKFNVNLKFIPSDAEKQRLHLSTGQAGDIISLAPWLGTTDLMLQGVKEGIFADLGKLVKAEPGRYPTMEKIFQDQLYKYFNNYYYGSGEEFYCMWGLDYTRNVSGAPVYNKKIMDELGLSIPKTVDEFVDYLRTVKAKKPDIIPFFFRNDKGSWLPGSSSDLDIIFFQPYGLHISGCFKGNDGIWRDAAVNEANKQIWKRLAGMYKEGLIDKEIFTKEADKFMAADFATGKTAVVTSSLPNGNASSALNPYDIYKTANPDVNPESLLDYIVYQPEPLTGPAGYGKCAKVASGVAFGSFITSTSKNPDRALDVLNWIISDEGQTVLYYGIEGVHYKSLDEQGRVVGYNSAKFNEDNKVWGFGGLTFGFTLLSGSGTRYLPDRYGWSESVMHKDNLAEGGFSTTLPKKVADYGSEIYDKWSTEYYEELPTYYNCISFTDEYKEMAKKIKEVKVKYFVGFIFGTYDVDKDWNEFVKEFEDAGGSKYAEEYGRLLDIEKGKFEALGK